MNEKLSTIKSNLKQNDMHDISADEYDELPELTDAMFVRATYRVNSVETVSPRRRGRQKAPVKVPLYLRLPAETVDYFKSEGPGWQTRQGQALTEWVKKHPRRL